MITKIKITLRDGSKYKMKEPNEICRIDPNKEAIFLFNNGQIYEGCTNGEVDEDGDFMLRKPQKGCGIGLPFGRLVGWAYKKKKGGGG